MYILALMAVSGPSLRLARRSAERTLLPFFAFIAMAALESFDSKIFLKRARRLGR